jgi:periplasmic protein TonB
MHVLLLVAALSMHYDMPRLADIRIPVQLVSDPARDRSEPPPALPPARLVVPAPVVFSDSAPNVEFSATLEEPPVPSVPVASTQAAAATTAPPSENLISDLSLQCPERSAPRYPPLSKRQHEQGEVVLRVELDESGRVALVSVLHSSGSSRLDEAARTAVETWHCRPAERQGRSVRAVALQSLEFVLEKR